MKTTISTITFLIIFMTNNVFGQSTLPSLEELNKAKQEAINKEDYAKAAEIKNQIDAIQGNQTKIDALQIELDKKIKAEDYAGAAQIKEEIQKLKGGLNLTAVKKIEAPLVVKSLSNNTQRVSEKIEINGRKYYYKDVFITELGLWPLAKSLNDEQLSSMVKTNKKLKTLNRASVFTGLFFMVGGAVLSIMATQSSTGKYDRSTKTSPIIYPHKNLLAPGLSFLVLGATFEFAITTVIKHNKRKRNKAIILRYNTLVAN